MRDPNSDIPIPEDLKNGKDKIIFGNIETIYEWHREYVFFYILTFINCLFLAPLQ